MRIAGDSRSTLCDCGGEYSSWVKARRRMIWTATDRQTETADWRAYFAGAWRMTRRIDDRRGARRGDAVGEANFGADPDDPAGSMTCTETLEIDYGGRRWPGVQQTVWRFHQAGGPRLFFGDGRFFCEMQFVRSGGHWRAEFEHRCGDDRYRGAVRIVGENVWRLVWSVSGPRKNYSLDTIYNRTGKAGA